jgi:5-methylcytosine-specific restriction endonuclease McrA
MKTCAKCREVKPMDAFGNQAKNKDGKYPYCNECERVRNREYLANPIGRARRTAGFARYQRKQAEKSLGNPIKCDLTSEQVAFVLNNGECIYCRKDLTYQAAVLEHVIALKNGGENTLSNVVCSCGSCNVRKRNRPVLEFLRKYSTPLQARRVIDRLSQRRGIGYFDMWNELNEEVTAEQRVETLSG